MNLEYITTSLHQIYTTSRITTQSKITFFNFIAKIYNQINTNNHKNTTNIAYLQNSQKKKSNTQKNRNQSINQHDSKTKQQLKTNTSKEKPTFQVEIFNPEISKSKPAVDQRVEKPRQEWRPNHIAKTSLTTSKPSYGSSGGISTCHRRVIHGFPMIDNGALRARVFRNARCITSTLRKCRRSRGDVLETWENVFESFMRFQFVFAIYQVEMLFALIDFNEEK